jgi:hypothetical protein
VADALRAARADGPRQQAALAEALAEAALSGDRRRALDLLRRVVADPGAVVRLDSAARREWWFPVGQYTPVRAPDIFRRRDVPGPVGVALRSMHHDGRVRAAAVDEIAREPTPELTPFLAIRTGDWVVEVRARARAVFERLLREDADAHLPVAMPISLRMDVWRRGDAAVATVNAAFLAAPEATRTRVIAAARGRSRRLLYAALERAGALDCDDRLLAAEDDPDVWVRARAAAAICREPTGPDELRRLARCRRPPARAFAVAGLLRAGHDREVAAYLDDASPLVRASAREAARRLGIDACEHYRRAVADRPTPRAIECLAEIGSPAEAATFRPLLEDADGRVRAAAVRARHRLGEVDLERNTALLHDPSAAVVREAATALRPFAHRLPSGLVLGLLDDARPEVRRAGYRLLATHAPLRAALLLAADDDPGLARQARLDATRISREGDGRGHGRRRTEPIDVAPVERDDLCRLLDRAAAALGPEVTARLRARLVP